MVKWAVNGIIFVSWMKIRGVTNKRDFFLFRFWNLIRKIDFFDTFEKKKTHFICFRLRWMANSHNSFKTISNLKAWNSIWLSYICYFLKYGWWRQRSSSSPREKKKLDKQIQTITKQARVKTMKQNYEMWPYDKIYHSDCFWIRELWES